MSQAASGVRNGVTISILFTDLLLTHFREKEKRERLLLIKEMTLNRKVTGCFLSLMFPPNISLGKSDREINSLLLWLSIEPVRSYLTERECVV